jgi:hypothetical protein
MGSANDEEGILRTVLEEHQIAIPTRKVRLSSLEGPWLANISFSITHSQKSTLGPSYNLYNLDIRYTDINI